MCKKEILDLELNVGTKVELKKQHPCGNKLFTITRTGIDVKLRCDSCGRVIMLDRETAEKRIKKVLID